MSPLKRLKESFSPDVARMGEMFVRLGRVRGLMLDGTALSAEVTSTSAYRPHLTFDGRTIAYACNCGHTVQHGAPCGHLWAMLTVAEQQGMLARLFGSQTKEAEPQWRRSWAQMRDRLRYAETLATSREQPAKWPDDRQLIYGISDENRFGRSEVYIFTRRRGRSGGWMAPKRMSLTPAQWLACPDPIDRQIALILLGKPHSSGWAYDYPPAAEPDLFALMAQTGRLYLYHQYKPFEADAPLEWDPNVNELKVEAVLTRPRTGAMWRVEFRFRLGDEVVSADDLTSVGQHHALIARRRLVRYEGAGLSSEVRTMMKTAAELRVPDASLPEFIIEWNAAARTLPLAVPPGVALRELRLECRPHLHVRPAKPGEVVASPKDQLIGTLTFHYGDVAVSDTEPSAGVRGNEPDVLVMRDLAAERSHRERLKDAGFSQAYQWNRQPLWTIQNSRFPPVAIDLIGAGWEVTAEGGRYRVASSFSVDVKSGIDWFDVSVRADFEGQHVALPELLKALRTGSRTVKLGDGTVGVLPQEWLEKHAALASLGGEIEDGALRVKSSQAGLLDALLATLPQVSYDEAFSRLREELRNFDKLQPTDPPAGFVGELRPYQKVGLGWMEFLRRCRLGGCLADDMGLGKTVQVLAMLEARREAGAGASLVVVPKSLMFNWMEEAKRFVPQMRILDQTGTGRLREVSKFADYDLVLTTYGTLQRDISYLREFEFDYVILDESQAIKNASTATAKAVRLLRGRHRLAMSGTPIENRIEELWSLLEFLNPGMLGAASVFRDVAGNGSAGSQQVRQVIARAVRPFILRRTKSQVASDLPEKTEQTIHCELEPAHRKLYDELRRHYRASLMGEIERVGLNHAKFMVLEALLRLRQAACHPGLVNESHRSMSAAKVETLIDQLREVTAEGHKALVFSQFTSLLSIVKERLGKEMPYEYLDGQTRDRQARVERFQNDPDCRLFLVSLKAGGVGLNLTAAEYVYLLDPWWNPAVEAQAIDRTHRIGQTRSVFAYRLIARDTVEEKVLQLQQSKRELADAIVNGDSGVLGNLQKEDLELLLS